MYEYLIGNVTFVCPYYIALEVDHVGYQVSVGNPYRYGNHPDEEIKLYIHQVIREDAHQLYGFADLEEKQLFLRLISVSGIGPKSALAIMASEDHAGLIQAIEQEDAAYLTKFPGVGKKTAQQMILDLKGKLGDLELTATVKDMPQIAVSSNGSALDEALEALTALGYSERELKRILPRLKELESTQTDEYLRYGLKLMMKK